MSGIDLVDFRILDQLQKTGSISRAAEKIRLSQPSISVRLVRLRRHFKDPLFVRTSYGMRPTPRAEVLIAAARQALGVFDQIAAPEETFDAGTSERTFRICMTDVQIAILPRLVNRIRLTAGSVRIEVLNPTDDMERMLEAGEIDMAIGVTLDARKGLIHQPLFEERFACLVSKKHRRIGNRLTKEQFLNAEYVAANVRSASTGLKLYEWALSTHKIPERIVLKVPTLLGVAQIVANTDLLGMIPYQIAVVFAQQGRVKALELPVDLPSYQVRLYWHRRYHLDPGHKWLRSTMTELFNNTWAS